MMQSPELNHSPTHVLFDYLERAAEELGFKAWFSFLRPGREQDFHEIAEPRVRAFLYSQYWQSRVEMILKQPEENLRWQPREDPEEEIRAHYILQAAIVATLMGDTESLKTLAAQLIIEPMNRKLAISYFLGHLTGGQVGLMYKELPSKAQVSEWVRKMEGVQLTNKLSEIAKLKFE